MAKIHPNNDSSGFDFMQRSSKLSSTVNLKIDMGADKNRVKFEKQGKRFASINSWYNCLVSTQDDLLH